MDKVENKVNKSFEDKMNKSFENKMNKSFENNANKEFENRDTSGDTKVFKIIKKEDIEKEKARQLQNKQAKMKESVKIDGKNRESREHRNQILVKNENNSNKIKRETQNENIINKLNSNTANMDNINNSKNAITSENNIKKQRAEITSENNIKKQRAEIAGENNIKKQRAEIAGENNIKKQRAEITGENIIKKQRTEIINDNNMKKQKPEVTHQNIGNKSNSEVEISNRVKKSKIVTTDENNRKKIKNVIANENIIKQSKNVRQNENIINHSKKVIANENIIKQSKKAIANENNINQLNNEKNNENKLIVQKNDLKIKNKNNLKKEKRVNNKTDDNKKYQAKNNKKDGLIIILVLIITILVIVVFSTAFGIINMNSNKIVRGVKSNQIELADLTKEEAVEKLNSILNNNEKNVVVVKRGDVKKEIKLDDINGKFDVEDVVNKAYNLGRENDIVKDNYNTILIMIKGENLVANFSYDDELLTKKINELCLEIPDLATDSSYIIEDNKLIIKNSKSGVAIKTDEFKQELINAFSGNIKEFELPVEHIEKKEIDIEAIHNEIYKEAVNAYYTTNPFKVYKEEYGRDFAITLDQAKKLLNEDKTEYEIQLKNIKPSITVADLDSGAFPNVLSTFTTNYGTGDANRNANIALAAKSINSTVVMPGEVFSYNDLIGECSTKTGYKTATIYLNGKLSTGVGGGICQVSTTLYNAVLRANLEIVQRRNHSLGVTYVPAGQDAMVNIGTSDFKFKNNREYPIKVVAYVGTGSITCQIQGLKQDPEYEVKLESKTIESTETKYKVETYKVLYLNGKVVSRTWLSTDTYKRH